MIDGITCRVHGDSLQNIVYSTKLQFVEYQNRIEAKYKGLIITIYRENSICYLRGSIHKFKNDGIHNADLFTYLDFKLALNKLEQELGVFSLDLYVVRFEIGVNVPLSYPVWQCLNTIALINNRMPAKSSCGMLVEYQQYSIKVYSKSKQYPIFKADNIVRIEIAYHKKEKLTKDICKISILNELLNPLVWRKMANLLNNLIFKIVFFDYSEIRKEDLTIEEALIFYEWSNPVRISQEPDRVRKFRYKKRAHNIYLKYSTNYKSKQLINLVKERLDKILKFKATAETD